jgi:PAS domain S-box-containing protein
VYSEAHPVHMREPRMSTPHSWNGLVLLHARILDHMTDAVIALDGNGRFTFWNRAAERFFHLSAPDVLGKSPKEVHVYPWLTPNDEGEASLAVSSTGVWCGEAVRYNGSGHASYVESTITALTDPDGAPVGMLAVIRDITKAKRKELEREAYIEGLRRTWNPPNALEGLLPICAHCKRIRDERGSWQEFEVYVGMRLQTKFSHGICPRCLEIQHPDCCSGPATP